MDIEQNVNEYNTSLLNMKSLKEQTINFHLFDTTNTSERKISIDIANTILDDMRSFQIKRIKKELRKIQ